MLNFVTGYKVKVPMKELAASMVDSWAQRLLDLSKANRLLNVRDTKHASLPISRRIYRRSISSVGSLPASLTVANVVSVANSNFQLATLVLIIGNILTLATFSKGKRCGELRRCAPLFDL